MKLFLDENTHAVTARKLLKLYSGSIYAGTDERFHAAPDDVVFRFASRNDFVLITFDLDFSNLRLFPPAGTSGIIVVRPHPLRPLAIERRLLEFLASVDPKKLKGKLAIFTPLSVRFSKGQL